jgi:hypothetical protein
LQVDQPDGLCRLLPAQTQASRHALQRRVVSLDGSRVKAGHDDATLALPGFVVGSEKTPKQTHLGPYLFQLDGMPKAIGAIA